MLVKYFKMMQRDIMRSYLEGDPSFLTPYIEINRRIVAFLSQSGGRVVPILNLPGSFDLDDEMKKLSEIGTLLGRVQEELPLIQQYLVDNQKFLDWMGDQMGEVEVEDLKYSLEDLDGKMISYGKQFEGETALTSEALKEAQIHDLMEQIIARSKGKTEDPRDRSVEESKLGDPVDPDYSLDRTIKLLNQYLEGKVDSKGPSTPRSESGRTSRSSGSSGDTTPRRGRPDKRASRRRPGSGKSKKSTSSKYTDGSTVETMARDLEELERQKAIDAGLKIPRAPSPTPKSRPSSAGSTPRSPRYPTNSHEESKETPSLEDLKSEKKELDEEKRRLGKEIIQHQKDKLAIIQKKYKDPFVTKEQVNDLIREKEALRTEVQFRLRDIDQKIAEIEKSSPSPTDELIAEYEKLTEKYSDLMKQITKLQTENPSSDQLRSLIPESQKVDVKIKALRRRLAELPISEE